MDEIERAETLRTLLVGLPGLLEKILPYGTEEGEQMDKEFPNHVGERTASDWCHDIREAVAWAVPFHLDDTHKIRISISEAHAIADIVLERLGLEGHG
jgi:hypothetical protein